MARRFAGSGSASTIRRVIGVLVSLSRSRLAKSAEMKLEAAPESTRARYSLGAPLLEDLMVQGISICEASSGPETDRTCRSGR